MPKIRQYNSQKIFDVICMTREETNKYYSELKKSYHSIQFWEEKHTEQYNLLEDKRKSESYIFKDPKTKGIIVFSELDKGIKWEFVEETKLLF